jgi:hypothetical protein
MHHKDIELDIEVGERKRRLWKRQRTNGIPQL